MYKKSFSIYLNGIDKIINDINNKRINSKGYVCAVNTHSFAMALYDNKVQKALKNSFANVPDGVPISLYASIESKRWIKRVYGPDLMKALIVKFNENSNKKIFFLGGDSKVVNSILIIMKDIYPQVIVAGFDTRIVKLRSNEDDLIQKINKAKPDVVFVGIGCPRQEIWMHNNSKKINSFLIGVGAAFDFFSGNKKQAPKIIQVLSLEWLYRLFQEPKRLFWRYVIHNSIFIAHCFLRFLYFIWNKIRGKLYA